MPEQTSGGARILLVDDHPAVREGLSLLLAQNGIVVCGEAGSGERTLELLGQARPDLVLVDLSLGKENGLEVIGELHRRGMVTLIYSMHDDARHIEAAFAAGAQGYVTKWEMAAILLDAIREVLAGRRYFSPVAALALADKHVSGDCRLAVARLSEREREIFRRTGEGDSAADIARHLEISVSTVETYYARIIDKLGLSGVKEMRRQAIKTMTQG